MAHAEALRRRGGGHAPSGATPRRLEPSGRLGVSARTFVCDWWVAARFMVHAIREAMRAPLPFPAFVAGPFVRKIQSAPIPRAVSLWRCLTHPTRSFDLRLGLSFPMNALLSLWLPILLSAVVVFVISSLIHMVFKW